MDIEVEWSPEASEDLEFVAEYIARDSECYASAVVSKILEVSRNIRDFPLIGRMVPETGEERIRERFIYSYRLVYRIEEKRILVVAVIHGKRLFDSIAKRFETGT